MFHVTDTIKFHPRPGQTGLGHVWLTTLTGYKVKKLRRFLLFFHPRSTTALIVLKSKNVLNLAT